MDNNIQEIQELYINEKQKESNGRRIEEEKVILIKSYEELATTIKSSFIYKEIENLKQYMKFIQSPMQTRLFKLLPHYTLLHSRGDQDQDF